jgi:lipopolysaccharide/colanic/teichoic acid biosynthesis glycosyltransferase
MVNNIHAHSRILQNETELPKSNHLLFTLNISTDFQMYRLIDAACSCILFVCTFPLLLAVAIAIRCESAGPVLQRQACIGAGGRRFQMLKFRTTIHDPGQTLLSWPSRPTRVGSFLRYTRIEHLPQLVNVLRGEMGIVDPGKRSPSFLH